MLAVAMKFICSKCDEEHSLEDISFGADTPEAWSAAEDVTGDDSFLGQEVCILDEAAGKRFFVRGVLEILRTDGDAAYIHGSWAEMQEQDYAEMMEIWDDPDRDTKGPWKATLATSVHGFPNALGLQITVRNRPPGQRPTFEVHAPEHALAEAQRDGISTERLREVVEANLHAVGASSSDARVSPIERKAHDSLVKRWGEPDTNFLFGDGIRHPSGQDVPARMLIMIWRADEEVGITTFASVGMSSCTMDGCGHRAEIHFAVRAKLTEEQERHAALWVANVAAYPFHHKTHLDWWHMLRDPGSIPCFSAGMALIFHPRFASDGWDTIPFGDTPIHILNAIPITQQERELVRREGRSALLNLWEQQDMDVFSPR